MPGSVIAVGVDDSEASHKALAWAAQEAVRRGSTLELVTTWTLDHSPIGPNHTGPKEGESLEQAAHAMQKRAVEAVLAGMDPQPQLSYAVTHSTAADALVAVSKTSDMIVVGTHGRGPVRTFLFGSVAQTLLKQSECPVVVIPPFMVDGVAEDGVE